MITQRQLTTFAMSALLVFLLALTVMHPVQAASPVKLEFWGWWASATRMPTIERIVNDWNEAHPDVEVSYSFVPFDEIMTKYLASVAAGNPPDVVVVPDIFTTPQRAQRRQAMNLSALGADEYQDLFYPAFWEAVQHQGEAYAFPWVGETKYLYYNKEMFREVGLDPEVGPKSWDDLWNFADKLDVRQGNRLVRAGFHPLFGNFEYAGWVWNSGSVFFDDRDWPVVNSEANVKVLDWIKQWTDRYGFTQFAALRGSFGGGPQHPFIQERVAMINETATWEGELQRNGPDIDYGIVPVPTQDGVQHESATYTGGFAVEVPVGTKHPKEAFEFALYWATEAAVIWGAEQNDFPAYMKAAEIVQTPEFQRMADNMKYTALVPVPLLAPTYMDVINLEVEEAIAGRKTSQEALDDAQRAIVRMIEDNL